MARTVRHELKIVRDIRTGHFYATCPSVKGFAAQGKDFAQLVDRIPRLMKALLEANGRTIRSASYVGPGDIGGFEPIGMRPDDPSTASAVQVSG